MSATVGAIAIKHRPHPAFALVGEVVQKPILLGNPVSDTEFVAFMRACAADVELPDELQARLREKYPAALVRPRLIEGEQHPMWYIYRDGRWQGR